MVLAVAVLDGLAAVPPGPELAAALAVIDVAAVPNDQLLPVLRAQSRQAAHEAARLLGIVAEVGRANPTFDEGAVDRLDHPFRHAPDEVRAALAWSRRAADRECDLAEQVVHNLPMVFTAYLSGEIDRPKVAVLAGHLAGLTADQVQTICQHLVPVAGRLTPGQLAHRLRRLIAAIDPRHYERRYRKALRDRCLTAHLDENGTAVLTVGGLSPLQATAALERVDVLAHAARRAGHPSTLDQIRVDIVAGLLDATLHHLTHEQIIAHLLAHRAVNDDPGATGTPEAAPTGPDPSDTDRSDTDRSDTDRSDTDRSSTDQRIGIEVRVALSTLLGHDDHPGEIPALGPIPATAARETVTAQTRAEWRYAITDSAGRLIFDGVTRRRPASLASSGPAGGIVELQIPATLLEGLTAGRATGTPGHPWDEPTAAWQHVLADIARQYAERDQRDLDAHPHDRLPRAGLRRHTQIRDRSCIGPGCRQRPRRCDQDHTLDHQHGGPTIAADLAPVCRHDHTLKHVAGWRLEQPLPGTFVWTSPLRGRYRVQPEPVLPPLPDPHPADDDPAHDYPPPRAPDTLILWMPDSRPYPSEPAPIDLADRPPF